MNKYRHLLLIIFSFLCISLVVADEITLKNGSRIVGEVLTKEGNNLKVKTPFAGTLIIKWVNIVELKTDAEVKVLLKDNSIQMANSFINEADVIKITSHTGQQQTIKQTDMTYINPELWRLGKDYKLTGGVNVSIKNQNGNTNSNEFDLDGKIQLRRINDRLKFSGEYENDKSNGNQSSLNWLLLGKYDYFISKKIYLGSLGLFEHDEFADLDLRSTYGLHVGHQYYESKAINLSIEGGLAQVYEKLYEEKNNDFTAATWALNYDQFFFDDFVQFYHNNIGRINVSDTNKYILTSRTGLRFPLTLGFLVSGEIEADYDNEPSGNADKMDTTFRLKLGYIY